MTPRGTAAPVERKHVLMCIRRGERLDPATRPDASCVFQAVPGEIPARVAARGGLIVEAYRSGTMEVQSAPTAPTSHRQKLRG